MKIVIAPDKFKGSLTSFEVCNAIANGVRSQMPGASIVNLPMADGGDGFANVMAFYSKAATVFCNTTDAVGKPIVASYQWSHQQKTAIIELAAASGIALLKDDEKNPLITSSNGTGLLIKDAIEKGAASIILGLGGSATNDAGLGILQALGFCFFDAGGFPVFPKGENLLQIQRITHPAHAINTSIILACDVTNTMTGPFGATHTFAAQKGASAGAIEVLEKGMLHIAGLLGSISGKPLQHMPGLGAAGGAGAGLMLLKNINLVSGLSLVLEAAAATKHFNQADLVITGEGCFDAQTLQGKVVFGVSQLAKKAGKKVAAVCGIVDASADTVTACGINEIISLSAPPVTRKQSIENAAALTTAATAMLMQRLKAQAVQQFDNGRFC